MAQSEKWDLRFLELAKLVASWSKDPSTKVGAVITTPDNRVVSVGFNGFSRGISDTPERLNNRDIKYKIIVHAERNAILFARQSLVGCTLYTWPMSSCSACAAMAIQVGIMRNVAPYCPRKLYSRWKEDLDLARSLFVEVGGCVDLID